MKRVVLLLCVLTFAAPLIRAQQPEWMMRIPKYHRLTGGEAVFVVDTKRNATIFDGGAYDSYVTYDGGTSWEVIFDIKMFFLDARTRWKIDELGNWFYEGNVYQKKTLHLVTEDAGKTIRYLITDTAALPFLDRWEGKLYMALPGAVYFDTRSSASDTAEQGFYSSCDAGRTWLFARPPYANTTPNNLTRVAENSINLPLSNNTFIEYNLCTQAWDSSGVSHNDKYVRLSDGTMLAHLNNSGTTNPLRVQSPTVNTVVTYSACIDPETGGTRKLTVSSIAPLNDTMALIIGRTGIVATYGVRGGLTFIDIPPIRNPHQQVCDAGRQGDWVLLRCVTPAAHSDSTVRWTLLNMRTGAVTKHVRPGSSFALNLFWSTSTMFENQRVVPYSDSVWLAAFEFGEMMRTTNAGATWTMVDNIQRDERWGLTYVGVNRLYPRGDGTMAVLTDRGRLMVDEPGSSIWHITHMGPVTHTITTGSGKSLFTGTNTIYREDENGRYRSRYGPSTIYFPTPDTLWTSGDVVTRWTAAGTFIDTVLARRARFIKRVSPRLTVAAMDSVWFTFNGGKDWIEVGEKLPYVIYGNDTVRAALGDIVEADNGEFIVGLRGVRVFDSLGVIVDSIPGGIMRSSNLGQTWTPGSTGVPKNLYVSSLLKLPTGTLLCLASEVTVDPRTLNYNNDIIRMTPKDIGRKQHKLDQAYVYRSVDNGHTWQQSYIFPSRGYLPLVDPRLTLMPGGRVMAINPDAGVAVSNSDGVWFSVGDPLNIGNPVINDVAFTDDGWAHFATNEGYVRVRIDNILNVHEEASVAGLLTAYVNAAGMLHIADPTMVPTSIRLVSIDGRTVRQASKDEGVTELDVSALAAGTYVVVASTLNDVRTALVQLYR